MTELSWPTPFGYTTFCDDIRQETLGKTTIVGAYEGELKVFGPIPAQLPKLSLVIHYFESKGEGEQPLELVIFLPGMAEDIPSYRQEIPPRDYSELPELPGEDVRATMIFHLHFTPFVITQAGNIRVRMKRGDDIVRLGSLRVIPATAEESAAAGFPLATESEVEPKDAAN